VRREALLALVACAGIAAGLIAQNAIAPGVFHDDGQYVILARSIAEHGTYRFDNLPGAPPGLHYPPGFPLFLSLLWQVAPGNIQVFRFGNALLLGAAAVAVFACARSVFGLRDRAAALVAVGVVFSAPFVWFNSMLISETLFVVVLCTAVAVAVRYRDAGNAAQAGIGALAGAVALVRSLGDPLGVVLVGDRLLRRRWRDAAMLLAGWLIVLAPWKLWLRANADAMPAPLAGAYGEYGAWWMAAIDANGPAIVRETIAKNVGQIPVALSVLGWGDVPALNWFAGLLVAAVAVVGAARVWDSARVVVGYALLYTVAVFLWPFDPDRFLLVLLPFVACAFAVGAREVVRHVRVRGIGLRLGAGALALFLVAGAARTWTTAVRTQPWERGLGERGAAGLAAAALVVPLPADARIASDYDELVHLATGRVLVPARGLTATEYTRPPSDSAAAEQLRAVVETFDITHVVVADVPTLRAVQWLGAHGVPLHPIASDSARAVVFARSPLPPPAGQ
jgi:hypothetical protein